MGCPPSRPVPPEHDSIFLQAMGRRPKERVWTQIGRADIRRTTSPTIFSHSERRRMFGTDSQDRKSDTQQTEPRVPNPERLDLREVLTEARQKGTASAVLAFF